MQHPRGNTVKNELIQLLRCAGAFDAGIASPFKGYENAVEGYAPSQIWPECRSIVVFAVAMNPCSNNTYIGPMAPHQGQRPLGPVPKTLQSDKYAMNRLARQMTAPVTLTAMAFLEERGFRTTLRMIQGKLSGYLAGLGVYGKSGLLLHPVLGNRMCLGVVMTNAELEPDSPVENYAPCENCSICIDCCPAGAYNREKNYPESWSRDVCTAKRTEIAENGSYCHNCFALCPAGAIPDTELIRVSRMQSISCSSENLQL